MTNTEPTGLPEIQAPVLPAAAQEAVAWQVGDDFYTSESLAIEGIQQWGPSGSIATPLYAAPVAAAPAVDVATLRALADRWATDRSYTGSPVDDIRALIEQPSTSTPAAPCTEAMCTLARKLLWVAYVWNDHNFEHPYKIARKLAQEFGIESFDQANAWLDEQAKLIDARPKGGSTDAVRIWGTQKPESMPKLFGTREIAELNWYPDEGYDLICMQVVECVQATSAEVKP